MVHPLQRIAHQSLDVVLLSMLSEMKCANIWLVLYIYVMREIYSIRLSMNKTE